MSSTFILAEAEEGFSSRLDFFNVPPVDTSITGVHIQEFHPVNPLSDRGNIVFDISNQSGEYMDLRNARLVTTLLIKGDDGKPIRAVDDVTLINMPCTSIYSQMDVGLQKTQISTGVGGNLAYKAILDTLLGNGLNAYLGWYALGGFFKDTASVMDDFTAYGSANSGLTVRNRLTKAGKEIELISPLICDIAEQDKLLINGVNLSVRLYPAKEAFRLLYADLTPAALGVESIDSDEEDNEASEESDGEVDKSSRKRKSKPKRRKAKKPKRGQRKKKTSHNGAEPRAPDKRTSKGYTVDLKAVKLTIPFMSINNAALEVVSRRLEHNHAVYPFLKSEVIAFNIPVGSYKWSTNSVFMDSIPDTVIIGLVSGKAYAGDHKKNPFNFQNFGVKRISFSVNGTSVPGPPLDLDYKNNDFAHAYSTLFESRPSWQKEAPAIEINDYKAGYAIYIFDVEKHRSKEFMTPMKTGNTSLSLEFADKTTESVNVIVYGKIPSVFKIDSARNVYLENQA